MKKIFIIAMVFLLMAFNAYAGDVIAEWEHEGGADGFTLYFWKTADPANVFNKTVADGDAREMAVGQEELFAKGVEYSFKLNAYNAEGQSGDSNLVAWTRPGEAYVPPADKMPTSIEVMPDGVDTIIIRLP
jgi:uncharacterized protein YxeA